MKTPAELMEFLAGARDEPPLNEPGQEATAKETELLQLLEEALRDDVEPEVDLSPAYGLPVEAIETLTSVSSPNDPAGPDGEIVARDTPFRLLISKPGKGPGCFGRLGLADAEADACRACRFLAACGASGEANSQRYRAWYLEHHIGHEDIGVGYDRNGGRRAVVGAGVPPIPGDARPSEELRPLRDRIRQRYLDQSASVHENARVADQLYRAGRRAAPTPRDRIEREHLVRLSTLKRKISASKLGKREQQIRRRESELALFWMATALTEMKLQRSPRDSEVAATFAAMPGGAVISRDQARSRRQLVTSLESEEGPWAALARQWRGA